MNPHSPGFILILVAALALIAVRVFFKLRAAHGARRESWDARVIQRLRSQGYAPFNEYPVDFFLALPDQAACQAVRERLTPEFSVDEKPLANDPDHGFSLHASKTMRLLVPDIQAISARMTALATEFKGRYDGWAA
ncbi:MAG: ribonuclease E inhibitor RraB [Steroidobacterales bacterium]